MLTSARFSTLKRTAYCRNIQKFVEKFVHFDYCNILNMCYNVLVSTTVQCLHKNNNKSLRKKDKMKKLDTLKKMLETVDNETLANIIDNSAVDIDALSDFEKLSVLMYAEFEKALRTKEHKLLLDCNYAQSKNAQNDILLVDYYRLAINNAMIQIYVKRNSFAVCTSASKANREQFAQLENDLHFVTKYDKKTNRAKTTQRNNIQYDELVAVVKSVIAVLENTAPQTRNTEQEQ